MQYKEQDYAGLAWRVDKLNLNMNTVKEISGIIPQITLYKEFEFPLDVKIPLAKIVAYIVYAYDSNSPFVKEYATSIAKRKKHAAEEAGFPVNKQGEFDTDAEKIIINKSEVVNAMIISFLKSRKSIQWSLIMTFHDAIYTQMRALINNTAGSDSSHIIKNIDELEAKIKASQKDLTSGDNNDNLVLSLYDVIENEALELRPEDIARKMRAGINPIPFTPYK